MRLWENTAESGWWTRLILGSQAARLTDVQSWATGQSRVVKSLSLRVRAGALAGVVSRVWAPTVPEVGIRFER